MALSSQSSLPFPGMTSQSLNSSSTASDKLSELPPRTVRSQNARAPRRSLETIPAFSKQTGGTIHTTRSLPQPSISDGSLGSETPQQRVSFDSERHQVLHVARDPEQGRSTPAASQSRSRAASPLRVFQNISAGFHRHAEDPFIPINPFAAARCRCLPLPTSCFGHSDQTADQDAPRGFSTFFTDVLPRQVYLNLLLRVPSMYFSRVARIFEDAEVSRPDIERMIEAGIGGDAFELDFHSPVPSASGHGSPVPALNSAVLFSTALPVPEEWTPAVVSPALIHFKHSWEDFIASLIREWKTLNVVSALLLSAILTMFQIPPAANDPITRTAALLSLVCALMSLCYGCVYIVRFSTMRSMYRASKFAEEARKTNALIWWNVWTLLAMPTVFLAWSVVFFIITITAFVWRTGPTSPSSSPDNSSQPDRGEVLTARIAISIVLLLGVIYFILIIGTLKRYGELPGAGAQRRRTRLQGAGADMEARPRGRPVERHSVPRRSTAKASRKKVSDAASPPWSGEPSSPVDTEKALGHG